MTGIIGALPEELEALHADLEGVREHHDGGYAIYSGTLFGQPVLLAKSGVGKVNAALLTLLLLQRGARRIVFTGVAGALAPTLEVGDLVVSTDAVQHDVDATAFGYAPGQVPGSPPVFAADPALRALAVRAAQGLPGVRVLEGRVASGDQFIHDRAQVARLRTAFAAACVEMEGAAVAQVCAKWGVPFVIIRAMSDRADGSAETDFAAFSRLAAVTAKRVVRGMLGGE
jgi:adenosylhomocysteine nucleosidase